DDPTVAAVVGGTDVQHAIVAGAGARAVDSNGNPWQGSYITASGNLLADFTANANAEMQGRVQVARLYHMTEDHGVRDLLAFLLARDTMHQNQWLRAIEELKEDGLEQLQRALLEHLEGHWRDLDNGLWEVRGPRRAFVHSKVMAWAGVDRMVRAVERRRLEGPLDTWRALRTQIHDDVCSNGFDTSRGTFTQYYGSQGLDAALLLIPQVGFLPWTDPRVVGTVEAVQREL